MIDIDLKGPEGNAFMLIGQARTWAKQLELDADKIEADMTSGDYDNLLDVFEENFGDFFTWNRGEDNEDYDD